MDGRLIVAAATTASAAALAAFYLTRRTKKSDDPCCAAGQAIYASPLNEKAGHVIQLADLPIYDVGEESAAVVVIIGTDIFGQTQNTLANADALATAMRARVLVPDFFRGRHAGELKEFTPEAIGKFIGECGTGDRVRADLLQKLLPFIGGGKKLHWLGFCWGGKMTMEMAADEDIALSFASMGGIHASLKNPTHDLSNASKARVPIMLIQAGNDADVKPVYEALCQGKYVTSGHVCRTFFEQKHGFCGARGDRSDPQVMEAVRAALAMRVAFFACVGAIACIV